MSEACGNCENCCWDFEKDCGLVEHPHCERCGHCIGRHGMNAAELAAAAAGRALGETDDKPLPVETET